MGAGGGCEASRGGACRRRGGEVMSVMFIDTSSNFHPYACGGKAEGCPHCQRAVTERHDPARCGLCDPEYDGRPNPWREAVAEGEPS